MGTALTGLEIKDTYDALLKITDNGPISGTLKALSDGLGTDSTLSLSTTAASIAGTLAVAGAATFDTTTLVVDATNNRVGVGTATPASTLDVSGTLAVTGAATFDTSTLVVDATNNRVGVGTATPATTLDVSGTLAVSGNAAFDTNTLFVDAAANEVGIGTATPSSPLDVVANNTTAIHLRLRGRATDSVGQMEFWNNAQDTRYGYIAADSTSVGVATTQAIPLTFATNTAERVRIDSSGNVGIGTSTPTATLDARIAGTTSGAVIKVGNVGTGDFGGLAVSDGGTYPVQLYGSSLAFLTGNSAYASATEKVRIDSAGNVGIGTSAPNIGGYVAGITVLTMAPSGADKFSVLQLSGNRGSGENQNGNIDFVNSEGTATITSRISGLNDANALDGQIVFETRTSAGSLTERLRIDSTGNVGIGTSAPEAKLHTLISSSSTTLTAAATLLIGNNDSTVGNMCGVYFSQTAGDGGAAIVGVHKGRTAGLRDSDLAFYTMNASSVTEKVRILNSGGITFNGDTAAANALSDYETGTWTMGVSFGGASVGVTTTNNTGTYTKIGRKVSVNGLITLTSKGSSTGDALITGLPFTVANAASNYSAPSLWIENITFANQYQAFGNIGNTNITLSEVTTLGVGTNLSNADFANNSQILLSFTYFV